MRELLGRTQDAMATEFAALAMEAWAKRRARTFQDAERGLCFGRLTLDRTLRPLYIGRRWVHDDDREPLVVELAGAGRAPLLYRDAVGSAAGAAAAPLPHRGAADRRHLRRVARRYRSRRRERQRLSPRGARAPA